MRKAKKGWLIAAAVLTAAGLISFLGAMAAIDFDFRQFIPARYETNTYTADETFDRISVDAGTIDMTFVLSADGSCSVTGVESDKVKLSVEVRNGTLRIAAVDARDWSDRIGFDPGSAQATIRLPQSAYTSLDITTSTGSMNIPETFTFEQVRITGDTSDIDCAAAVRGNLSVQTMTGDVRLRSALPAQEVQVGTDTGEVRMTDTACARLAVQTNTGDVTLCNVTAEETFTIVSDTGDVLLEDSDASEIAVTTQTGDVTGTLRTDKTYLTETSTGDVQIPQGTTGGKCTVCTDTGDICFK